MNTMLQLCSEKKRTLDSEFGSEEATNTAGRGLHREGKGVSISRRRRALYLQWLLPRNGFSS